MSEPQTERISSIDYFRAIAIFSVILIHTQPCQGVFSKVLKGDTSHILGGVIELTINQCVRFAVPFFYLMAGYFYGSRSASLDGTKGRQASYLKRILMIWIFWSFLYLLLLLVSPRGMYFYGEVNYLERMLAIKAFYDDNPISLLMIGGNLWFFPALIAALLVVEFFHRIKMQDAVLPMAGLLYGIVLLSSSYTMESDWSSLNTVLAAVKVPKIKNIEVVYVYINGLLYTSIGVWLSVKKITVSRRLSLIIAAAGLAFSVLEVFFMHYFTDVNPTDVVFLIGTIPLVTALATLAIANPEIGRGSLLARCGRYTLGIYVCHVIFIRWLWPMRGMIGRPQWDLIYPVGVWLLSLMLVLLLSRIAWLKRLVL